MTGGDTGNGRKAQLRERLDRARQQFLEAAAALSEEELTRPVGHESHWTAKDLIGHVAYAEAGMLPMARGAATGEPHRVPPDFDIHRWNDSRVRRAREQSVPQLLARLEESRREALALLDELSEADLDRPTNHTVVGETTVEGIFKIIAYHERSHAEELRAVHEDTAGAPGA
ncbi:MAG: DinB family protein [Chloroflexota bacterium]|nr:DinB family protein [Chloroflexota bacterium]